MTSRPYRHAMLRAVVPRLGLGLVVGLVGLGLAVSVPPARWRAPDPTDARGASSRRGAAQALIDAASRPRAEAARRGHGRAGVGAAAQDAAPGPIFLPWALQPSDPRLATRAASAAAATRAAATRTARAAASMTATATATETPIPTPSATETPSPTSAPPTEPPPSPMPSATGSPPGSPSPSPRPTATPTPAFAPRDPARDALRPRAAARAATPVVRWEAGRETYVLRGEGEGIAIAYEVAMTHPDLRRGRLAVREATSGRFPLAGAGLYYRRLDGRLVAPRDFDPAWPVEAVVHAPAPAPAGPGVFITVTERLEGLPHAKRYELAPVGGALRVVLRSLDGPGVAVGRYAGSGGSWIEGAREAVALRIPFMEGVPLTLLDDRWFVGTMIDLPRSGAGELLPRGPESDGGAFVHEWSALYPPDAAGAVAAVSETLWVTLSPSIEDAFAEPPGPVAPHRGALAGMAHVRLGASAPVSVTATTTASATSGAQAQPPADDRAAYLERMAGWRVTELFAHDAGWADPEAPPPALAPDPRAGGADGALRRAAAGRIAPVLGYTRTVAGCPGAPNGAYVAGDRVIGRDGLPISAGAWPCAGGEATAAWLLAPDGALRAATAHGSMLGALGARGVTVADVGAWNPALPWPGALEPALDRGVPSRHPATVGTAIGAYATLFRALQKDVGPVFGDGAPDLVPELRYDAFYAGYLDGFSPTLAGPRADGGGPGLRGQVVPDYALWALRPRAIAFGFGPFERLFGLSPGERPGDAELDRYRALLLAYGHAPAWEVDVGAGATGRLSDADAVALYHLVRPVHAALQAATEARVRYVGPDGQERDLTRALVDGLDLGGPRLRIEASGAVPLSLWVNLSANVWRIDAAGAAWLLPADGWLVEGPGVFGFSALLDGRRVDRMVTPGVSLLDGRGEEATVAGETARDLVVRFADGRVLAEGPGGELGWRDP